MGLKFVLSGTAFTDLSLPILRPDPLINAGSLFLVDMGRSETTPPGVPANGAPLLNLAWETAAAVIGSGNESTLAGIFQNSLVGVPTMGVVERTAKNGLHVIASQSAMDTADRSGGVAIPSAILAHVLGGLPGRSFYTSIWGRLTRLATASPDAIGYLGDTGNATRYAWSFFQQPSKGPADGSTALVGSMAIPGTHSTGNFFRAIAVDEFTGAEPVLGSTVGKWWFGADGIYKSFQRNVAASGVIYRVYIEDLTASGRSYADAVAADLALYNAAMGSGGRFNADTFTSPATIP